MPGATKAVRSTIESSAAKGEAVDVLARRQPSGARGGRPRGRAGRLDAGAVIASLRVEECRCARPPAAATSFPAPSPAGPHGPARRARRRLGAGRAAAVLVAIGFGDAARPWRSSRSRCSRAATVALLAWLAARPASEDSARAVVARLGIRRCDSRRALVATAVAAAALALLCVLLALAGAFESVRAPRELTRLDGLAWAAALSEPAVPFDGAAVASLLARAVIGAVVLELLLRGAVLPALARLIGAWPAIAATALIGAISFGALAGDGALLLPALALGLLLGPLLVATGSIVPGAALSAGFTGAALALTCGWGAAGAAATAITCAALAAAPLLAAAGRLPRRGGRRYRAARRLTRHRRRPERRRVHGRAAARRGDRRRDRGVRRRRPDRGPRGRS